MNKWGTIMIFEKKQKNPINNKQQQIPLFGYELLREDVLPDLLGKEHSTILYWAGKSLARKYPLASIEEMIDFFQYAGWGELKLIKEKKSEAVFELTATLFENKKQFSAPLEAGFIAEQIQKIKGFMTEANETAKSGKLNKISFQVIWDIHDESY